jgi:hypothetical protein
LFRTEYTSYKLRNSVPYKTADSWRTDYTTDVDLTKISVLSIILPNSETDNLAGFIEMDKKWVEQTLTAESDKRQWEFLAISLAASKPEDYMHHHLTIRRNVDYPLVFSRNVR